MQIIKDYKNKIVLIFGLGRTGLASAHALKRGGAMLRFYDDNPPKDRDLFDKEWGKDALIEAQDFHEILKNVVAIVISPGIAPDHDLLKTARALEIEIISDIDLLYLANKQAKFIGITGTNGKSTTTALVHHLFKMNGYQTEAGGNLGVAALDLKALADDGIYILELSSYQLEYISKLRLEAAVILNLTPDHLARHKTMQNYAKAKGNIFQLTKDKGAAIIGMNEAIMHDYHVHINNEGRLSLMLLDEDKNPDEVKDLPTLPGMHNQQNIAASLAIADFMGLDRQKTIKAITSFEGLPHRLQMVDSYHNIRIYNDSKATNPDSTAHALKCFDSIFWLAGGQAKSPDFSSLSPYLHHVKKVFLFGEDASLLFTFLLKQNFDEAKIHLFESLKPALEMAVSMAMQEKVKPDILFSPACASFDHYQNFEKRGEDFLNHLSQIINTDKAKEAFQQGGQR